MEDSTGFPLYDRHSEQTALFLILAPAFSSSLQKIGKHF
jgi:hypothetical protein